MAKCSRWDCARFLRLQNIGSGFASTVYLALDTLSNTKVALKVRDPAQSRLPMPPGFPADRCAALSFVTISTLDSPPRRPRISRAPAGLP